MQKLEISTTAHLYKRTYKIAHYPEDQALDPLKHVGVINANYSCDF